MLYINSKLVNFRSQDPNYEFKAVVDDYHQMTKDLVNRFGDTVRIQTRQKLRIDSKTGYLRLPAAKGLLLQASVSSENGIDEWVYSPNILKVEDGVVKITKPNLLIEKGELTINIKKDPDLIFFCLATGKVGRTHRANTKFHLVDQEDVDMEKASIRRLEGKMVHLIYSAIPEQNLKVLAKSWGIGGVDRKHIEVIRTELEAHVLDGEKSRENGNPTARGIEAFVNSSEVNFYDQVAALVRDAEEGGSLIYDADERKWVIDYHDGNTPYILKELAGDETQTPLESIIVFLTDNNEKLVMVERAIGKEAHQKKEGAKLTVEMIQGTNNYLQLKSMAKQYAPDFEVKKGVSTDTIKQALLSILLEVPSMNE